MTAPVAPPIRDPDNALIVDWLGYKEGSEGRSVATMNKYQQYLERLARALYDRGRAGLLEASSDELESFCGLDAHRAGLAPRSRRPLTAAVKGFYKWATRRRLLGSDPAARLVYPRSGLRLPVPMRLEHAEKLLMAPGLDTFLAVRDTAMFALLIGTGLRISGLVSLNESNLLFARDEHGRGEQLVVKVLEKGGKQRLVPADGATYAYVRAYLGHPDLQDIDRVLDDGDQVLFPSLRARHVPAHEYRGEARRMRPSAVRRRMRRYGLAAGIPESELHPHALRHLYGTELAEDDTPLNQIQALMGHASATDTAIYIHLAQRKLAKRVHRSSPMIKMRTPAADLARELARQG